MNNQSIDQIVSNLSKCDYDFALSIIITNFKGTQKELLTKFLNAEISVDTLKRRWGQVNITGNINEDVKNADLKVLERLKLVAVILHKLGVKNNYLEVYNKAHNTNDDYAKALALLLNDILSKDKLRVRNKESWVSLLEKIRKDDGEDLSAETELGLLPHSPEEVNVEEEEVVDVDAVVI